MTGPIRHTHLALAILGLVALSSVIASAQSLPSGSTAVAPLRRGPDGRIEAVDPSKASGPATAASAAGGGSPCAADALCVGPGLAFPTLGAAAKAARPGAVIEVVAGTYRESIVLTAPRLVVRGIAGRPHFDCAGIRVAQDKACLLLAAADITLDNLEISGAEINAALGENAACIRNEPNLSFTLRKISCHSSQDGVLGIGGSVVIEDSDFFDNGWTGYTHNAYLSGDCAKVTVHNSTFRDARVGHELKSRCRETEIVGSTFMATRGSRALDLPDGGLVTMRQGLITQGPKVDNPEMIGYAPESCKYPGGGMTLDRVKIVGENPAGTIANFDKCEGAAIRLLHVEFQGIRPQLRGKVVTE
jgi:hypothetical protein